jgi:hypothetical protein
MCYFVRQYIWILLGFFSCESLYAQTAETFAWLTVVSNTALNAKWALATDVQLRSESDWQHVRSLFLRTGLSYRLNNKSEVLLGHLLNDTFLRTNGVSRTLTEHQLFEQYVFRQRLKATAVIHRLRIGQRFIEREAGDVFAQSGQYFIRATLPLAKQHERFERGLFVGLQNEIFLNVQNRHALNGSYFDQNRAFAALGYRLNQKLDAELGYLNHEIKGRNTHASNNILQLVIYTRF